ncbi:hypothetical protein QYS60_02035 [Rhodococcus sp. GXMU-t2271]|uniref:Uncharacterized protein n=1 Tax=Rhodococcus indonesiensis TaxID=3055869 RepID=A0ABT7RU82_9NOCA|nr:hypothetical protein [Rhodococcus indonesiensis]MDM7491209.1 hypothetical protein [Rhodococcus indonesiensis]
MDPGRQSFGVHRWSDEHLDRLVEENPTDAVPERSEQVHAARIELARRRDGGTFDWTCLVEDPTDPDRRLDPLVLTLPTGVTEEQVHTALLARARVLYGSHVLIRHICARD